MKSNLALKIGRLPPPAHEALKTILRNQGCIRILRSLAVILAADSRDRCTHPEVRPLLAEHAQDIRECAKRIVSRNGRVK